MKRSLRHLLARCLAVLALSLQLLLPGTMAAAQSGQVDVSRYLCAPSGHVTEASRAAAERLAKALGDETPAQPLFDGHCPLCTLVHAAPLPAPPVLTSPRRVFVRVPDGVYQPPLVRLVQGPPLGSRGPPVHN